MGIKAGKIVTSEVTAPIGVVQEVALKSIVRGVNARSDTRTRYQSVVSEDGTFAADAPKGEGSIGVNGMADDLEEKGQLQPIGLRPCKGKPGFFETVWGNRRLTAAELLAEGKRTIKGVKPGHILAIVEARSDLEACAAGIVENGDRDDIDDCDLAFSLGNLKDLMGQDAQYLSADGKVSSVSVARKAARSQTQVYRLLTIVETLRPNLFAAWRALPSESVATEKVLSIAKLPTKEQTPAWDELLRSKSDAAAGADPRTDEGKIEKACKAADKLGADIASLVELGVLSDGGAFQGEQAGDINALVDVVFALPGVSLPTLKKDKSAWHGNHLRSVAKSAIGGFAARTKAIEVAKAKQEETNDGARKLASDAADKANGK
jgi:ParB-like chromosome segregation protein Spo0J